MIYILSEKFTKTVEYIYSQTRKTNEKVSLSVGDFTENLSNISNHINEKNFLFCIGDNVRIRNQIGKQFRLELSQNESIIDAYSNSTFRTLFTDSSFYDAKTMSYTPKGFIPYQLITDGVYGFYGQIGALTCYIMTDSTFDAEYFYDKVIRRQFLTSLDYKNSFSFSFYPTVGVDYEEKLPSIRLSNAIISNIVFYNDYATLNISSRISLNDSQRDELFSTVYSEFGDVIYAEEDISLAQQLVDVFRLRKKKLVVVESITGGLISSKIVAIPNASAVLQCGLVTYSNESKMDYLSVSQGNISEYTAVSKQVAREMTNGIMSNNDCDYAIATTGYAGPTTERLTQPVGLCYISVASRTNVHIFEYIFNGDRNTIRNDAANMAIFQLLKFAKNN